MSTIDPNAMTARLIDNPALFKRIESILDIAENDSGNFDNANDAEQQAIIELRKLGNELMNAWGKKQAGKKTDDFLAEECKKKRKKVKEIKWHTTFGDIIVTEQTFLQDGVLVRPFVNSAGVTNNGYSLCLQRVVADFGADSTFGSVLKKMVEHYGIMIPDGAPRKITEKHGENILNNNSCFTIPTTLFSEAAEQVIVQSDGSMIPVVEIDESKNKDFADKRKKRKLNWKEARLTFGRINGEIDPYFAATVTGSVDMVGDQMMNCAQHSGMGENTFIHGIGDGAKWIANQIDSVFGSNGKYTIDMSHLSEYLSNASKALPPNKQKTWFKEQKKLARKSRTDDILAHLIPYIEDQSLLDEKAPVRVCYRYINNRPGQFDYEEASEAGLPIGSGEIESAHRYVIQNRLKVAGAWWKIDNAEKMLALRTVRQNDEWDFYWREIIPKQNAAQGTLLITPTTGRLLDNNGWEINEKSALIPQHKGLYIVFTFLTPRILIKR